MSRLYNYPSAPLLISTPRFSSNQIRKFDLVNADSDSLFLLTLARSNFSVPGTPTTPTTPTTFGSRSSAFPFPPQPAQPSQSFYSLFADPDETLNRARGAPVWPAGFAHEEEEERQRRESYIATIKSNTSSGSGSYRGQAVEIHHGTARITAWMKKAVKKITPKSWRRDEPLRGRMTLD